MGIPSELSEGIEESFKRAFFDKKLSEYLGRGEKERSILSSLQKYDEKLITEEGKRFRAFLPVIMADGLDIGLDKEQINELFVPVEAIHGVSLVFDDVIDRDELRRGMKTTHEVMKGRNLDEHQANSVTSLDAFHLQSRAERIPLKFDFVSQKERIQISEAIGSSIERLCEGQVLDVASENLLKDTDIISEEDYLDYLNFYNKILKNKTAPLFEVGPEILEIVGDNDLDNLKKYSFHLAMAYQIRDDIIDIEGPGKDRSVGYEKDRFSDVRDGNITLPIFYVLKSLETSEPEKGKLPSKEILDDNGKELVEILDMNCLTQEHKRRIEDIIDHTDAIERSKHKVQIHLKEARAAISDSNIDNDQKELLDGIANYAAKREV